MQRAVVAVLVVALVATPIAGATLWLEGGMALQSDAVDTAADGDTQSAIEAAENAASASSQNPATAQTRTIQKDIELFLTPSEAGAIDVEVTYDVPDEVTSLRVGVPEDARDVESTAFTSTADGYEWDGDTDPASLAFTLPANQSATGARSPSIAQDGQYSFVDTGPWAMVTVPGLRTEWSWRSSEEIDVDIEEDVAVAGEGSTGGEIAFLGPTETYTRTANGQTFTFAVPEAAALEATPDEILDALVAASGRFHVGARDAQVWFAAAPTDADWGIRGVEYGGSDAWVLADSRLDQPGNVWFHEYVHTRQDFRTATSGRWTTEGAAEYYSALLALRTGYVGFEAFETHLSYGERSPWRDAVLSEPATWSSGANYVKGALVWGELDRRVRLATDSTYTLADVFYRLNHHDDRITNADVLSAIRDVSSGSVAEDATRYTETSDVPDMWTRSQHDEAFDTEPPRMEFEVREYRLSGPLRNESFTTPPTMYVGETVTVETVVTNDGGQVGEYNTSLAFEETVMTASRGELAPGDSDTIQLSYTFADAGTYTLSTGRNPVELTVREPAAVEVADLSVADSSVPAGTAVTATLQLSNPSDAYASGPVAVTLNDDEVASVDVSLAPGQSTTRTVSVTLSDPGEYVLAAGDREVTVAATDDGGEGDDSNEGNESGDETSETGSRIPGFGVGVALVAFAVGTALATRD